MCAHFLLVIVIRSVLSYFIVIRVTWAISIFMVIRIVPVLSVVRIITVISVSLCYYGSVPCVPHSTVRFISSSLLASSLSD